MRIRMTLIVMLFAFVASDARAQTVPNAGPNDSFGWNQAAATLTEAQGFVYKYYLDGAVTGSVFSGVTCTGTATPFSCKVRIPTFAPGQHSITFTAANITGESVQSSPFVFVYGNPPANPNNISIIKATTP
jgi:hypothetical protein